MRRDVQFECYRTQFVPGSAISALHVGNVDRTIMRVIGEFFGFAQLKYVASASGRAGMNARSRRKDRACIAAVETATCKT